MFIARLKDLKALQMQAIRRGNKRESRSGKYSQYNSGDLFASMALHIFVCQQNKDRNLIRSRSTL